VLAANAGMVASVDTDTAEILKARMEAADSEGLALRKILLENANPTIELFRIFRAQIVDGASSTQAPVNVTPAIAQKLLDPVLACLDGRIADGDWGVTLSDCSRALMDSPTNLRVGAIDYLREDWLAGYKPGIVQAWRQAIIPLFSEVWPKARGCLSEDLTEAIFKLLIGSGDVFPEAFDRLRPYLTLMNRERLGWPASEADSVAEKFPHEMLKLLWIICGPYSDGKSHELGQIIDVIIVADPSLKTDKRLQWLEQKATWFR